MRRTWFTVACGLLVAGCGASAQRSYDAAYAEAPEAEYDDGEYFAAAEEAAGGADYYFADEYAEGALMEPAASSSSRGSKTKAKASYSQRPGKSTEQRQAVEPADPQPADQVEPEDPMVVYMGFLKLRVKRLLESVDEVTRITEERGGYVESLTSTVIVVRVPASDFEAVMTAFSDIGEQLERRVKALDVTEQFTDLGTRLAVAKQAQARLLKLLARTEDVEERLRILREIKRLSEQIESFESTLATLQNLVDYFTITIELVPVLEQTTTQLHRSPFPWVRELAAHVTSIREGKDDLAMALPDDFVLFDKDDTYRAQAADTTVIRAGWVDNEPHGDDGFWAAAVDFEMVGRDEELVDEGEAGPLSYRVYRSADVQPRLYLVAVHAVGEELYVVEVFYPTQTAYEKHHEDVVRALSTFEVK